MYSPYKVLSNIFFNRLIMLKTSLVTNSVDSEKADPQQNNFFNYGKSYRKQGIIIFAHILFIRLQNSL